MPTCIEDLANETLEQVFLSVSSVSAALDLSATCHRLRRVYLSSSKLSILEQAAEKEYGPINEIIQLVTHNASQPAHIRRHVPLSDALLHSIVRAGHVAVKWEDSYVFKKWKMDFENRRTLTDEERFDLRKAVYRLWLFSRAFHNSRYSRLHRLTPSATYERAALLHNFNTFDLAQMLDVHDILRSTVSRNICPSNGIVRTKFQKRSPQTNYQLLFSPLYTTAQAPTWLESDYYHSNLNGGDRRSYTKYTPSRNHEPGGEGWGDEIMHYYVIEDMLKLDPEQMLWLKENAPFKHQVETYVKELGDWFDNNGETFVQTLQLVLQQRGEDWEDFRTSIADGESGVALTKRRDSVVYNKEERERQ